MGGEISNLEFFAEETSSVKILESAEDHEKVYEEKVIPMNEVRYCDDDILSPMNEDLQDETNDGPVMSHTNVVRRKENLKFGRYVTPISVGGKIFWKLDSGNSVCSINIEDPRNYQLLDEEKDLGLTKDSAIVNMLKWNTNEFIMISWTIKDEKMKYTLFRVYVSENSYQVSKFHINTKPVKINIDKLTKLPNDHFCFYTKKDFKVDTEIILFFDFSSRTERPKLLKVVDLSDEYNEVSFSELFASRIHEDSIYVNVLYQEIHGSDEEMEEGLDFSKNHSLLDLNGKSKFTFHFTESRRYNPYLNTRTLGVVTCMDDEYLVVFVQGRILSFCSGRNGRKMNFRIHKSALQNPFSKVFQQRYLFHMFQGRKEKEQMNIIDLQSTLLRAKNKEEEEEKKKMKEQKEQNENMNSQKKKKKKRKRRDKVSGEVVMFTAKDQTKLTLAYSNKIQIVSSGWKNVTILLHGNKKNIDTNANLVKIDGLSGVYPSNDDKFVREKQAKIDRFERAQFVITSLESFLSKNEDVLNVVTSNTSFSGITKCFYML